MYTDSQHLLLVPRYERGAIDIAPPSTHFNYLDVWNWGVYRWWSPRLSAKLTERQNGSGCERDSTLDGLGRGLVGHPISGPVMASLPRGQIKQGDLAVTESTGGGLAWGTVVLRW